MGNNQLKLHRVYPVGRICVGAIAILFIISYVTSIYYPATRFLSSIFLGGFIGGFTNSVAIRMLFERYWFLPGSGVLLKRRTEIIHSLARTVETHIINPELLEQKLRIALEKVNVDNIKNSLNHVIETFKDDILQYVNSNETHAKVVNILKDNSGLGGRLINVTGIKDFEVLAHQILDSLDHRIEHFAVTDSMVQTAIDKFGSFEDFIFKKDNPLVMKHYDSKESIAFLLLNKLDIQEIVVEKLSQYPAEKIRDIIESNTRDHMAWLEVFGVILGVCFTALFLLIQR